MDLDPEASGRDADSHQLSEEISQTDGEDQLAFRQGRRYVGRLVRYRRSATQATPVQWRTDSSYLISGGLLKTSVSWLRVGWSSKGHGG